MSDEQFLQQFYLSDDPAMVATELADGFDMSRQGAYKRLEELVDEGHLKSKQPGRDRIYWLTSAGREAARQSLRG